MILDSPDLGAPRAEWEQWLAKLRAMPQNDRTVAFAIRRAVAVLKRYDERDSESSRQADGLPAVSIDSDYPSEAAMDALRKLPVPKLKKTTEDLFTGMAADKERTDQLPLSPVVIVETEEAFFVRARRRVRDVESGRQTDGLAHVSVEPDELQTNKPAGK